MLTKSSEYIPGSNGEPKHFTPTKEEQTFLVLQGKCAHNNGWKYIGHGHNDEGWDCKICGHTKWY